MPATLPTLLAAYFAASNNHDVPAMIALFSEGAMVKDEGREYRGLDAIREWATETIRKYDFKVEPAEATEETGRTVVTSSVSGNFPGSPVRLRYAFSMDNQKVSRLEIG